MTSAAQSSESVKELISAALAASPADGFPEQAATLLAALGYVSDRTLSGQTGDPAGLIRSLAELDSGGPGLTGTQTERAFLDNAQSVRILFQFASSEIQAQAQPGMFDEASFDMGIARSFLFAAVELNGDSYPRGQYAAFTRELNKHVQIPTVVLFRTAANRVTLAFVHRRPNRRDASRDVLGSVSLIREIDAADPHRAHLDILAELSLPERLRWMEAHGKPSNFDGLLEAWLDALDTEELNRRFYNDLFRWFERAVKDAKFPTGEARNLPAEEHAIRLITRLMFVWFIKEKGLVAGDLFIENKVAQLLKDYDPAGGDSYYRAVLQNLFFATLNTEIGQRRFSARNRDDYRSTSLYRYRKEIADEDALLALFSETPFINGGLFDCLDSFEGQQSGGYRIDCFSDVHYRKLSIPNRLFFSADDREPGLIDLFDRYKFTVEENTPAEQEVALDPELLGKVFENLLAAYNPETRENARKQTGSYYTPRAVVDYMVDEALVATLAQRAAPADGDADSWQDKLRCLLDYNDANAGELFTGDEPERIVRAIAETKALDPAVGSGAFPMGILHKLTLALSRLDPDNELWRARQIELHGQRAAGAFWTADRQERDAELQEISATFQKYGDSDFGRKLYLIQNSIYGVDIQPVATQIAKLRFFISLAIEQERDPDAPNYGIRPLPNLETRFVAANSLLGLARPQQFRLGETPAVERIKGALSVNRERHFHATTRPHKMALRRGDAELRRQLAAALRQAEFSAGDADKVANWDPYDQNASADWFDPEYMFGMTGGFDVVIANPPYVVIKNQQLRELYKEGVYGRMNTYGLFIQRGLQLVSNEGQLTYINPRTLLTDRYFTNLRQVIKQRSELAGVVLIADRHNTFEQVLQECIILRLVKKLEIADTYFVNARAIATTDDLSDPEATVSVASNRVLLPGDYDGAFYIGDSEFDYQVFESMNAVGVKLADFGLVAETGKIQFDKYKAYAQPDNSGDACRLIWAENIQRYTRRESRNRVGREWLSKDIAPVLTPNITGMGIVTQRTSANEQPRRIIATLITPEVVGGNQVYSENGTNFVALEDDKGKAAFLISALNSSMMEFAFRRLNSNVHVSAGEINSLPFPPMPDETTLREIETLVSELMELGGVDCPRDAAQRALETERRLDTLIGALYGFTASEVEEIQNRLPPYTAVYGI